MEIRRLFTECNTLKSTYALWESKISRCHVPVACAYDPYKYMCRSYSAFTRQPPQPASPIVSANQRPILGGRRGRKPQHCNSKSNRMAHDIAFSANADHEQLSKAIQRLVLPNGKWILCNDGRGVERSFRFKTFKAAWVS